MSRRPLRRILVLLLMLSLGSVSLVSAYPLSAERDSKAIQEHPGGRTLFGALWEVVVNLWAKYNGPPIGTNPGSKPPSGSSEEGTGIDPHGQPPPNNRP